MLLFCVACLGLVPAMAAAEEPYELDPVLSLTGDCSTTVLDPVPDPNCPEGPNPPSGRFNDPRAVAVDPYGNIYVASYAAATAGRIDVFDDEGHFITEILDPNGPRSLAVDSKGTLYVADRETGDIVRYIPTVYKPEAGEIAYGNPPVTIANQPVNLGGVSVDRSNDHVFVTFSSTFIREYGAAAEVGPTEPNKLLNTISHPKLSWTLWTAVDAERRRLYASFCQPGDFEDCGVLVFEADAPYALLEELDGSEIPAGEFRSDKGWLSIGVDEETGDFFVDDLEQTKRVYQFNEDYEYVTAIQQNAFQAGNAVQIAVSNGETASGDAFSRHRVFVPVLVAAGRVLAFRPPAVQPPIVEDGSLSAANISEDEAEFRATVDPRGGETEYVFQYVTQAQFEESEFTNAVVGGEGTIPADSQPTQVVALLDGLDPGTAYRFRIVATNEKGKDEEEGSFSTYDDAVIDDSLCPNLSLRKGASALLPDCRAYELVTPADTNGRPPLGVGFAGDRFATRGASPDGNAATWLIEGGSLPGIGGTGGFGGDPFRSTRTETGWSTVSIGPAGTETDTLLPGSNSPDQGYSFWTAGGEGTAVVEGTTTHYVRYPDGHSELVGRGSLGTEPAAIGRLITDGGTHIIFQTDTGFGPGRQLEPEAPPTGTNAVYDRTSDEVTHVVSLLPGNVTPGPTEPAQYLGASADGEGIAFGITAESRDILYLRVGNAVTYEIGEDLVFAGVSEGGRRIFYMEDGDLFAFDTEAEEAIPFTEVGGKATVVNVAPDGTRAYFVSPTAIAGSGENPNGATAQAGEQNLYLSEEGQISFVATVTDRDVEGEINAGGLSEDGLGLWTEALTFRQLAKDPSRVNEDGSILLFQSRANLDGHETGGFPQVYRYDVAGDRLHCISCNPTGTNLEGGSRLQSLAASISERSLLTTYGFVPGMSPDGRRVFFESHEPLVARDTDGKQDVYEWEENGVGSCNEPGGCVFLISSGQSVRDDYLYGHSDSGNDVFFGTEDVLVAGDSNALSIYDARVGGGFPQPPAGECQGEGCRPVITPPPALMPPGKAAPGDDNVKPKPKPRRCPKGKRKVKRNGKIKCVKKKSVNRKQRQAGTTGRAGR